MAEQSTQKTKPKRRKPLGKRQLSATVSYSNLWIPDKQLLAESAKKAHATEAALIRDIVHNWAVKKRLAPDVEDGTEEAALIELQRETKTAVEGLSDLLNRLVDATSGYGDLLALNEAQITHITSMSNAHYNVTAQTFAALWALLEMFQRFHLEAQLRADTLPPVDKETHTKAVAITDNIRAEGLRMVERLIAACQSPQAIRMALVCPADNQQTSS